MVINQTVIATNENFKLIWDDKENEYQVIRKGDLRVREREDDKERIVKIWNLGYAGDDSKIETTSQVPTVFLNTGNRVRMGKNYWEVIRVSIDEITFITDNLNNCTIPRDTPCLWELIQSP